MEQQSFENIKSTGKDLEQTTPITSCTVDIKYLGHNRKGVSALLFQNYFTIQLHKSDTNRSEFSHIKINFGPELIFQANCRQQAGDQSDSDASSGWLMFQASTGIVELFGLPSKELEKWRSHLERKITQRGFHDRFKAYKQIGRGNFASVFLVKQKKSKQKFAIKGFLKLAAFGKEGGKQALQNEISVMRVIEHPNLMKLFGVYESKNSIYLCLELLPGGRLLERMQLKRLDSHRIKAVMRGLLAGLAGLAALHAAGIMHRDIKPENLLFRGDDYDCVIADFGLAETVKQKLLLDRCGTPGFMAPEIANLRIPSESYGTACDLFSAGVVFHMLLLGKAPFPGMTQDEVLRQNRACIIDFSAFEYQQLPPTWLSLLQGMLEADPLKRISAEQALKHEFFKKQPLVKIKDGRSKKTEPQIEDMSEATQQQNSRNTLNGFQTLVNDCSSPLLMTKNQQRRKVVAREDSCLKLKNKEAAGSEEKECVSPLMSRTPPQKFGESRLRRMALKHS